MYHDVYVKDTSESGFQNSTALKYKVRADKFETQVAAVAEAVRNGLLVKEAIVFTFDDGGVSFNTVAAPILEKYGMRGLFFIATKYIDMPGFLNKEQVAQLAERGHLVGSHSHTHPERISILSKDEIASEWQTSQAILTEILGQTPQIASIPNGYSSSAVLKVMSEAGIREIHTSEPTTKRSRKYDSEIVGRYAVTDDFTTAQVMAIATDAATRHKMALRSQVLGVAKTILGPLYLVIRKILIK